MANIAIPRASAWDGPLAALLALLAPSPRFIKKEVAPLSVQHLEHQGVEESRADLSCRPSLPWFFGEFTRVESHRRVSSFGPSTWGMLLLGQGSGRALPDDFAGEQRTLRSRVVPVLPVGPARPLPAGPLSRPLCGCDEHDPMRVSPGIAVFGPSRLSAVAAERQARGELPKGKIASIVRVR